MILCDLSKSAVSAWECKVSSLITSVIPISNVQLKEMRILISWTSEAKTHKVVQKRNLAWTCQRLKALEDKVRCKQTGLNMAIHKSKAPSATKEQTNTRAKNHC